MPQSQAQMSAPERRITRLCAVAAGFDRARDATLQGWEFDDGVGFRLAWNIVTVVSFDYGLSNEGGMFYMELGHLF